jgi:hypothetical protein
MKITPSVDNHAASPCVRRKEAVPGISALANDFLAARACGQESGCYPRCCLYKET